MRRDLAPLPRSSGSSGDPTGTVPPRVWFPRGLSRLVGRSGIGAAVRHQEETVRRLGGTVVHSPFAPADVVHLNTPLPDTPLMAWWARRRGIPVLMWAHSTEEDFRGSFHGADRLAPLFRRWIAHLYRLGDAVVTPTAYSRDIILRPEYRLRRNVHVLSNGVDTRFFRPDPTARERLRESLGLVPDAPVVVSVGLQIVRKGILDWVELARSMPDVTFVWYGRTDPALITAPVREAIQTAPPNCRFPGHVPAEVVREAYCGADAFVFLTHEETEGIVLLEALACAVPVIVRDIPIYHDWLPDGRVTHMVRGDGPAVVADARRRLTDLLAGRLPDLTSAGRAAAEAVDLDRVAEGLSRIHRVTGVRPRR
ncbi:glycosyltransferase [Brachybacterium sp. EF45031]|nr:glycosyltransferase [Brachybacterium sillae]